MPRAAESTPRSASLNPLFAQNIAALVGALILLVAGGAIVLLGITGVRVLLFRARQRESAARHRASRTGADGRPLPPRSLGVCDRCGRARASASHLADGRRLCDQCLNLPGQPMPGD